MNIFYLDRDPEKAGRMLCDKHIVRMPLESAQILCTVSWRYKVRAPYKPTHEYHPCVLWAGNSKPNWEWLVKHGLAICEEYTRRYDKRHKSQDVIEWCRDEGGRPTCNVPSNPCQVVPDEFKQLDAIEAYRDFYVAEKSRFAKWKLGGQPSWYINGINAKGLSKSVAVDELVLF